MLPKGNVYTSKGQYIVSDTNLLQLVNQDNKNK